MEVSPYSMVKSSPKQMESTIVNPPANYHSQKPLWMETTCLKCTLPRLAAIRAQPGDLLSTPLTMSTEPFGRNSSLPILMSTWRRCIILMTTTTNRKIGRIHVMELEDMKRNVSFWVDGIINLIQMITLCGMFVLFLCKRMDPPVTIIVKNKEELACMPKIMKDKTVPWLLIPTQLR